ncbi:histidine kinase [Pseudonocardia alaniniphila]
MPATPATAGVDRRAPGAGGHGILTRVPATTSDLGRVWAWLVAGDPEYGWIGRLLGTAVVLVMLMTSEVPPEAGWAWVPLGAATACWLFFVVADARVRGWPAVALTAGAAAAATAGFATAGFTPVDASGLAIAFTCLVMLIVHPAVRPLAAVAITVVVSALLIAATLLPTTMPAPGDGPQRATVIVATTAIVLLSGLLRRTHQRRAAETAALLEQTRAAQDERARAAALEERTRIARELHDVLAHSLGALGIQLEVAEALLAEHGDRDAALERVSRSRRLAADGLVEARAAVAALRRDALPLPDALTELAVEHARDRLGDPPEVDVVGRPRPIRAAVEVALAGTVREAFVNAARHAPGAELSVVLTFRPGDVSVTVHNGSSTASPMRSSAPGHGLTGMRERLALVGGHLTAGPDGPGWTVVAEVPDA